MEVSARTAEAHNDPPMAVGSNTANQGGEDTESRYPKRLRIPRNLGVEQGSSVQKLRTKKKKSIPRKEVAKEEIVGMWIRIQWPDDRKYYAAKVVRYDARTNKHKIVYPDEERFEIISLNDGSRKWKAWKNPVDFSVTPRNLTGEIVLVDPEDNDDLQKSAEKLAIVTKVTFPTRSSGGRGKLTTTSLEADMEVPIVRVIWINPIKVASNDANNTTAVGRLVQDPEDGGMDNLKYNLHTFAPF